MESLFGKCIFCWKELTPTEMKGAGDHVIPQYLCGSFAVKDVCNACNSKLGVIADAPALRDPRMVAAVRSLDLPQLHAALLDKSRSRFVSEIDGSVMEVRHRGGQPRLVPRVDRQVVATDSCDTIKHLKRLLAQMPNPDPNHISELHDASVQTRIDRLEPGQTEIIGGFPVRKGSGYIHSELKTSQSACVPLIAKIGYEAAFYLFDRDRLAASPVIDKLYKAAFGVGPLEETILMYPVKPYSPINPPPGGPKYHHQIIAQYLDYANIIDIYFFGCVGFRLYLKGDTAEAHGPVDSNIRLTSVVMTFEPNKPKEKYFFQKREGEDIEEFHLTGVL